MVAPDWQEVAATVDSWLDGVFDAPTAPVELRVLTYRLEATDRFGSLHTWRSGRLANVREDV
jgi:hypothetical protein